MFGGFFFAQPFYGDFPMFGSGMPEVGKGGGLPDMWKKKKRDEDDAAVIRRRMEAMLTGFLHVIES